MAFTFDLRLSFGSLTRPWRRRAVERLGRVTFASGRRERPFSLRGRRRCNESLVVPALIWLLGTSASAAHGWYPAWCCSERDCRELSEEKGETVLEAQDGWHLWDGRLVARGIAKPSPDRKFHICEEPTTGAIICFFAPPGAT
jgi:hypothetical protein